MPQIINTNIASINAQRNLDRSQSANQTALQRLSSGLRINSAKDDAAGLAISTRFTAQIRGLAVATRNAGDGIALAQTAEGALGSINDNLQRIRELAVQSANATNSDADREALQSEVDQLVAEISRTAEETAFNGRKLLDGSFDAIFQIGANAGQTVDVSIAELTANNLGAAKDAGVSAIGNSSALANGDLIINGVAIAASKAGDDTASTNNASASAIAKVATINRASDQTGVTAVVNKNVVSGAEMSAVAGTTTLTLNGVEIALSTTASTVQTRAAVAEAINSVANQTGVRAINTNTDSGGVQLVAGDGRNIEVAFSNYTGISATNVQAATGLSINGSAEFASNQSYTYVGGYTLVADGDVSEINIDGGNGTGNGDLSRAGLTKGLYQPGAAATVSVSQSSLLTATGIDGANAGSLTNEFSHYLDNGTLITGGDQANTYVTTAAASGGLTNIYNINYQIVTAGGVITKGQYTINTGTAIYDAASGLNGIGGIKAYEQIEFVITDFDGTSGGETLFLASASIALVDSDLGAFTQTTARLDALTENLNNASYKTGVTVTAELNATKTAISVRIRNESGEVIRFGVSTGLTTFAASGAATYTTVSGVGAVTSGNALVGALGFSTSGATVQQVTLAFTEATDGATVSNDLYTGPTVTVNSYGTNVLSSTGKNEINLTLDGTSLGSTTLNAGSTVNDLVQVINGYANVNAFENIQLTITGNNLNVGDTFFFGTPTAGALSGLGSTTGVGVSANDKDGDGSISAAELADAINGTNFSTQNIDVSAELNASGTQVVLNIRNYDTDQVHMLVRGQGRSLHLATGGVIGAVTKTLSGELRYASENGGKLEVSLADATQGGEFYSGNSSRTSFDGVNGLSEGDITINGVVIGAAKTEADTASALEASDSTKILSSSKELSGIAIAAAINDVSAETGVRATVNATEVVGGDGSLVAGLTSGGSTAFAIGDSAAIYINGVNAGTVTLQANGAGLIDSDRAKADALNIVNSVAGRTGVVATDNGVSLTLTAADGRNISVAIDDQTGANASIGALFGLDAGIDGIGEATFGESQIAAQSGSTVLVSAEGLTYETTYSTVKLSSAGEFNISAGSPGADELVALGLNEGDYGGAVSGTFLTDIDISTFEGAQAAITSIDNAIGQVASQRAVLGAIQNRLESTVSNLQITKENLQAANSRIVDADFAAETAELSRTQVLQQAGISVLAQANALPQQVLSLLQ